MEDQVSARPLPTPQLNSWYSRAFFKEPQRFISFKFEVLKAVKMTVFFFSPEDGDSMFLRTVIYM
jgi:hypothetical protein